MTEPIVTCSDLLATGWQRSHTGYWLSPDGDRIISERDALAELTRARVYAARSWRKTKSRETA